MSGCPGRPQGALSRMSRCPVVGNEPGHGFAPTTDIYRDIYRTTGTFSQFAGTSLAHSAGRRRYLGPCWLSARLRLVRIGRALPARQHLTRRERDMGRTFVPVGGTSRDTSFIAVAFMALVVSTVGRAGLWPRVLFIVGFCWRCNPHMGGNPRKHPPHAGIKYLLTFRLSSVECHSCAAHRGAQQERANMTKTEHPPARARRDRIHGARTTGSSSALPRVDDTVTESVAG